VFWGMNVYNVLQYYLPAGAILISPKAPNNARGVRLVDVDGDGKQEIIVLYRWRGKACLMILKDDNMYWTKLADIRGNGFNVDYLRLIDITGKGTASIVLGWELSLKENELNVYTFEHNKLKCLCDGIKYSKIEVENLNGDKNSIIIWNKVLAEAYNIKIFSWDGQDIALDNGNYPNFYNRIVSYYMDRLKELPRAAFYWYYLADAQIKANMLKDVVETIDTGVSLDSVYPTKEDFEKLKEIANI